MNPGEGGEGWTSQAYQKKKSGSEEMGHGRNKGEGREMDIPKDGIWVLENTRKRAETLEKVTKVYTNKENIKQRGR